MILSRDIDDNDLVEFLRQGDHEAYECLFTRYYAAICAYASRFVGIHEAEDVADDCMVWLWDKRHSLDIKTTFRQYLFTMVYHRAVKIAIQNRISDATASYMEDYYRRHQLDEHDFIGETELKERINNALKSLPETYRDAFVLHRFEGKSYKEIASLYNLSPKTIDYRIQQALKQLRKELGEYLPSVALVVVMGFLETAPAHPDHRGLQDFSCPIIQSTEARYCSVNV